MAPERRRGRGRGGKPPEDEAADHDLATDPQQSAPEPQATKPKRKKITPEQLEALMATFEQDRNPDLPTRQQLAAHLNLTNREVQVWFQNKRSALRRKEQATAAATGPSSSRPDTPEEKQPVHGKVEWSEARPYLDASASSRLAIAGVTAPGPTAHRLSLTAAQEQAPVYSPIPIEGVPLPSHPTEAVSLSARPDSSSWRRPSHPSEFQSLPPLPAALSRSNSQERQARLHRLSTVSALSDPVAGRTSPEAPHIPRSSACRRSSAISSASSPLLTEARRFTGDPPPLPQPETDLLNLSTSRPVLPLPDNLVLRAPPELTTAVARRPWTGNPELERQDALERWEREYWTRRST